MRALKKACSCGATLHQVDEPHRNQLAEQEWDVWHSGEGHGPEDYMVAVQVRERRERERLTDENRGRN